jgi:hypothetical protein
MSTELADRYWAYRRVRFIERMEAHVGDIFMSLIYKGHVRWLLIVKAQPPVTADSRLNATSYCVLRRFFLMIT